MLFTWLRKRRRDRILSEPFPDEWLVYLKQNVPLYALLSEDEQEELRELIQVFVAEKYWEGCGGLEITDEIKVTIAAQACILLLGIEHDDFRRVESILVYPNGYRSVEGWAGEGGIVEPDSGRLGEAWYDGPVVLAWGSVRGGGQNPHDGRNVVMHEFAHQLDFLDGYSDGTPPLSSPEQYRQWQQVMTAEYARLVDESERGQPDVLDSYGATNHAEFFAVATECFFEKPVQMRRDHPQLYQTLADYYQQDSADRFDSGTDSQQPKQRRTRKSRRRWWDKRTKYRGSRQPTPSPTLIQKANQWPGWVRFWNLMPSQPRADAVSRLDRHLLGIVFCATVADLAFTVTGFEVNEMLVIPLALVTLFCVSAGWLFAAIRWVDRNANWASGAKSKG